MKKYKIYHVHQSGYCSGEYSVDNAVAAVEAMLIDEGYDLSDFKVEEVEEPPIEIEVIVSGEGEDFLTYFVLNQRDHPLNIE